MGEKSFRTNFYFKLDLAKPEQSEIADLIEDNLKPRYKFSKAVRDGLRLITDLWAGKTDVLTELFPHIVSQIERRALSKYIDEVAAVMNGYEAITQLEHDYRAISKGDEVAIGEVEGDVDYQSARANFAANLMMDDNDNDLWDDDD